MDFYSKEKNCAYPHTSLRETLLKEAHSGGLVGHFGQDKTFEILSSRYYWPQLRKDTNNFVNQCLFAKQPKAQVLMSNYTTSTHSYNYMGEFINRLRIGIT